MQILALAFIGSVILGSIPFGLVLTKLTGGGDLRSVGSGNIGATNVLRTGKKGVAALTLILDLLKGTLAVLAVGWLVPDGEWSQYATLAAALGAVLGHCFSIFLKFSGERALQPMPVWRLVCLRFWAAFTRCCGSEYWLCRGLARLAELLRPAPCPSWL